MEIRQSKVKESVDAEIKELTNQIQKLTDKRKELLKYKKQLRIQQLKYCKGLIDFVSEKLGYDVSKKTNKLEYSNARFVIANHFLPYNTNKKDNIPLTICESVLNISHTTVLHGVKMYNKYKETNDIQFMVLSDKIEDIIKQYDKTKTEPITTDIQAQCGEATQFNRH